MERKDSDELYKDFFAQEENFDVLFFGNSHVMNGVLPLELWDKYGIVSYNLANHGSRMASNYWILRNALEYTTPKVVVVDSCMFLTTEKTSPSFSYMHRAFDAFPMTPTKLRAIMDLLDEEVVIPEEQLQEMEDREPHTKIGLLWDYSVYHARWNRLERRDFEPGRNTEKGAIVMRQIYTGEWGDDIDPSVRFECGTVGEVYFRKIIEECRARGIEVLLTYLPMGTNAACLLESHWAEDIAEEYGLNYVNFFELDVVNAAMDYCDQGHLNISGARKVTDYLGSILINNYPVENQKANEKFLSWEKDYEDYRSRKDGWLRNSAGIENCLMTLSGDDVNFALDIREGELLANELIRELLENLGADVDKLTEETDFVIRKDEQFYYLDHFREHAVYEEQGGSEFAVYYDVTGEYHDGNTGFFGLYCNGEELLVGNIEDDTAMNIEVQRGVVTYDVQFYNQVKNENLH